MCLFTKFTKPGGKNLTYLPFNVSQPTQYLRNTCQVSWRYEVRIRLGHCFQEGL